MASSDGIRSQECTPHKFKVYDLYLHRFPFANLRRRRLGERGTLFQLRNISSASIDLIALLTTL